MAFLRKNLYGVGGRAGNPAGRVWTYDTTDSLATVAGADYFVLAVNELQLFDIIIVRVWATAVGTGTVTAHATNACGFCVVLTAVAATPTVTTSLVTKIATA